VLEGTVRRLVLEVCARHEVPVSLSPPSLADLPRWQAALISSTSRLLLPIDWVGVPAEGQPFDPAGDVSRELPPDPLARRLVDLVRREVEAASTEVVALADAQGEA
jgi:branched-subunit amino acid aminotransferase/4-amino-4-deoxychorismate lyase